LRLNHDQPNQPIAQLERTNIIPIHETKVEQILYMKLNALIHQKLNSKAIFRDLAKSNK
jgi:hypothetical protein